MARKKKTPTTPTRLTPITPVKPVIGPTKTPSQPLPVPAVTLYPAARVSPNVLTTPSRPSVFAVLLTARTPSLPSPVVAKSFKPNILLRAVQTPIVSGVVLKSPAQPSRPLTPAALSKDAAFEASRSPRQRQITSDIENGKWFDDWTLRATDQDAKSFEQRSDVFKCKPRPLDSRVNRGGEADADLRQRFVPWCERKR